MIAVDKNRLLLLWVAAGAGMILLYSAYKGKSPLSVVEHYSDEKKPVTDLGPSISVPDLPGQTTVSQFTTDSNGFTVDIPPAYQGTPGTFIPSPYDNG